jgi:integrase
MGMIYKRGKVYWIKYYRDGKPYYESTGTGNHADAKLQLKRREGEIAEGKRPSHYRRTRFDDLAADFLRDYKIAGKRVDRAELSVSHLRERFDGMRANKIDTPQVRKYIEMRQGQGAANASINRELAALKAMFNLAAKQTPPRVAQVPYIPMLEENNVRTGFFEKGDYLALRDALPDYLKGFVTFGYKTGWRVSEIRKLTWSQVDRDQWAVRIERGTTKNKRETRTIYLDEELKEIFQRQWKARKQTGKLIEYVFPNWSGTGKIGDFRGAWNTACLRAKIGKRIFHDFRRTAVRDMVRARIPERVAMMISGHSTRDVFERYNIVSDADLKEAAIKREAHYESQPVTKTVTILPIDHASH